MTVAPYRLVVGRETFGVTELAAGEKFAAALEAATAVKPRWVETPKVCAHCEQPLVKYPCRSAKCVDAKSAHDARVERNCDDL